MLETIRKIFSFRYDDQPLPDAFYHLASFIVRYIHDYYFRVEHAGDVTKGLETAKKEKVIFISNHALTFEAALLGHYLLHQGAGKIGTLVFPEAFRLPLIREFFKSCQCVPISIDKGSATLHRRSILLFPEGMDFLRGLTDPDRMPPFHTGFLRIAKKYLNENGRRSLKVIPIAHAGVEKTVKFWVIKNPLLMDFFIRPFAKFPFWVLPKIPFILPYKVVMNWGAPIILKRNDLNTERKIDQQAERFRLTIHELRMQARDIRENNGDELYGF